MLRAITKQMLYAAAVQILALLVGVLAKDAEAGGPAFSAPFAISENSGIFAAVPYKTHEVRLYRMDDGNAIRTLSHARVDLQRGLGMMQGRDVSVRAIAFSPDGQLVAMGDGLGQLIIMRVDGSRVQVGTCGDGILSVEFGGQGKTLVVGTHSSVLLVDPQTIKLRMKFRSNGHAVALSPSEQFIAFWDFFGSKITISKIDGYPGASIPVRDVKDLLFLDDARLLVRTDHEMSIFDVQSGQKVVHLASDLDQRPWHPDQGADAVTMALSQDRQYLATAGSNPNVPCIWSLIDNSRGICFEGAEERIVSVGFAGRQLLAVTTAPKVYAWNISSGTLAYSKTISPHTPILLYLLLASYVYGSTCLYLVARKIQYPQPWRALIPILNLFTMASLSGRRWAWGFLLLVPFLNLIILGFLGVGLFRARGKNPKLGALLAIPGINLLVLTYLAMSR